MHASPFPTTTTSVKFELEQTPPRSPIDAAADDTAPSVEMEDSNSTASQERTAAQERPAVAPPQIKKVNLEEVNDDIVEAVIVQLQETGNRPHHVKELATVLLQQLRVVQQ